MPSVVELRFNFVVEFAAASLADALAMLRDATRQCTLPRVLGVVTPMRATMTKGAKPASPDVGALLAWPRWIKDTSFTLQFGETSMLALGWSDGSANMTLNLAVKDMLFDAPAGYLAPIVHIARHLMREDVLTTATLTRFGDDRGGCVPAPPIALRREPFAITTVADVAAMYDDVDAFLAAWDVVEYWGEHGDKLLLARCLENPIDRVAILDHTIADQWAMARAAKPRVTFYSDPVVHPDEQALYEEARSRLELVGTREGVTEYSCVLTDVDDHLAGHEIYALRGSVQRGVVRVVFKEQWMAEQEKRPLLDVGVRVFWGD